MRTLALALLPALGLMAQESPATPTIRMGLGTFTDQFSDSTGTWKGWLANAEWYRDASGPWSLSVAGSQRPEGRGTLAMLGKETAVGDLSWLWVSAGGGSGADFLPTFRGNLDLSLGLDTSWSLEVGGFYNRFRDNSTTIVLQAGPGWKGEVWSASLRLQQVRYAPDSVTETGYLFDLRWGAHNLKRWHSLRLGWGEGVLDALQPSGSLSTVSTTFYGGSGSGRRRGAGGSTTPNTTTPTTGTTTQWIYPSVKESLVGMTHHLPITPGFALRLDASWGRREGQFTVWSGTVQTLVSF